MTIVVVLACFAALGALAATGGSTAAYIAALAAGGLVIGAVVLAIQSGVLAAVNGPLRREAGAAAIRGSVARGFLLLVPFTIMAAVAELAVGWDAALVMSSAALMTSSGSAGADVARRGGRRLPSTFLPLLIAMAAATLWAFGVAAAPELVTGAGP